MGVVSLRLFIMDTRLELLQASYWEHFKAAKDMARWLGVSHPKRVAIEREMGVLLSQMDALQHAKQSHL